MNVMRLFYIRRFRYVIIEFLHHSFSRIRNEWDRVLPYHSRKLGGSKKDVGRIYKSFKNMDDGFYPSDSNIFVFSLTNKYTGDGRYYKMMAQELC